MSQVFIILMALVTASCHGQLMPRIEQNPVGNVIVNVSDPVTLEYRASGEPRPEIAWYKGGKLQDNHYTMRPKSRQDFFKFQFKQIIDSIKTKSF